MQALWNNKVIAEANQKDLIYIEGNWYFPPSSVNMEYLSKSPTLYTCPWKGDCQYFNLSHEGATSHDSAFCYPKPLPSAIDQVKKDFSNFIAFWRDVEVIQ